MTWHANASDLLRRTGAAGPVAARAVLDALVPGAPSFAALASECLACAAGAGPHPEASAADLDRIADALALLAGDLFPLLLQTAELTDLPERMTRAVYRGLASDERFRGAAVRLAHLAAASDRLAAQVRKRLKGRDFASLASAVTAAAATAGIGDFVDSLCAAAAGPDEVRDRSEAFARAARLYAEGRFVESERAWAELADVCPGSEPVGAARAAANAARGETDLEIPVSLVPLPPGEWLVADESKSQAGFDRLSGPPALPVSGRLYQLRVSTGATDEQMAGLARHPIAAALYALVMTGCARLTDGALAHLTGLTTVRVLDLGFWDRLTDVGLAHVSSLTALRTLSLTRAGNVTDAGLEHLVRLSGLRSLDLTKCERVTDAGLEHLARLSDLRSLELSFCPLVTDAGLGRLARLTRLQNLSLDGCPFITDAGLAGLHRLADLRMLTVGRCDAVTEEGMDALRAALPECEVWG